MRVEVESQGEVFNLESETPLSINQILSKLEIPPSTVLVVYDGTILPHTSIVESDVRLELITVSSGG
ncbi:MAG: MoaD/ThiS family protein [Candidatus Thalassarchaeaceae archaeon]|jgi:sulfur carrier protein ThiS